jgi:hypothetical protein
VAVEEQTIEYFIRKAISVFQKELNSEIVVKDNM